MKLTASRGGKIQLLIEENIQHHMKEFRIYMIQVAPWHEDSQCYTLSLDEENHNCSEVQALWEDYPGLLTGPNQLPLCRLGVDHAITLQEGAI